jgi:hypothetical protein
LLPRSWGPGRVPKLIDIDGVQGVGQDFQNQMRRKPWCSIGNGLILAAPNGLEVNLQFISRNVNIVRRGVALAALSSQRREEQQEETLLGLAQAQTALSMPLSTFIREA